MYLGLKDSGRMLRAHVKPSRFINTFLVELSYFISRFTRKPIFWGMPTAISIEHTTACSLSCPQCPSGLKQFNRPTGKMSLQQLNTIIPQISRTTGYITLYFQGEPYINKDFTGMIAAATKEGIYTATSSNAHFLTPETYDYQYRRGYTANLCRIKNRWRAGKGYSGNPKYPVCKESPESKLSDRSVAVYCFCPQ